MRIWVGAAAVLLVVVVGCDDPQPVVVPDFVGMTLPEARDAASAVALELDEVDGSGRDRSVFSRENWFVEEQDPPAGTEVDRRATVTVMLANVRDIEPEPEPQPDDPEPDDEESDHEESDDEPDDEDTSRTSSLDAAVSAHPSGLRITPEVDVHDCRLDLNPGMIRSGYTTRVAMMTAGQEYVVPWGDLTNRDGERFNYATHRPEQLTISCSDEDGNHVVDTWQW